MSTRYAGGGTAQDGVKDGQGAAALTPETLRMESTDSQQLPNSLREALNDTSLIMESPNRMIEDWDVSSDDFQYEDNYEMDSDLLSSDEACLPKTARTSTPWKARTRSIPPLYIPRKENCLTGAICECVGFGPCLCQADKESFLRIVNS